MREPLYLDIDYANVTQIGMDDAVQMPGRFPLSLPRKRSFDDYRDKGPGVGQRKVRLIDVQPRNIQDLTDEVRIQETRTT